MQSTSRRESWCSRRAHHRRQECQPRSSTPQLTSPQHKRRPHQGISRQIRRNWLVPRNISHHLMPVMRNLLYMHRRKCPIAMRPLVREKLDEFLEQGIITPVEEPMDWVSSLAYSWKANGKLRVCLRSQRCQQSHQERSLQDSHC